MGVQDRDWWREAFNKARYDPKEFRRPTARRFDEHQPPSRIKAALIWVLALASLYLFADRLMQDRQPKPTRPATYTTTAISAPIAPSNARVELPPSPPLRVAPAVPQQASRDAPTQSVAPPAVPVKTAPSTASQIFRCGNTYQDHPCAGSVRVDATPNTGVEVRNANGAVVHSPVGDKARYSRAMEQARENMLNGITCGLAGEPAQVRGQRIDCPTAKTQANAKRLTPDYIKKAAP